MLSDIHILAWQKQMQLSQRAKVVIDLIRDSGPARRVGGGRSNVSGRYPSKKMGTTIQFESHRVELAAVYELEHDPDVLEYFDQPPSFKLEYASAAGRNMGVFHTADYFAVRKASAGWEECKTQEELVQLSTKNPNRYRCADNGRWICPPGEAHAEALGLYYRVRSSRDIDWVFQRNIQFLEDYLRSGVSPDQHKQSVVFAIIAASPGITLAELFEATAGAVSRDDIYGMVACGGIYVDLCAAAIMEPLKVLVFTRKNASMSSPIGGTAAVVLASLPAAVTAGSSLLWDGRAWKILNNGATSVSLLSETGVVSDVPLDAFEAAIKGGHIIVSAPDHSEQKLGIWKRLAGSSEDELRIANARLGHVARFLSGEQSSFEDCVPSRTLRRWVTCYQQAEKELGSGYLGLLPQAPRGNATAKLPEEVRALLNEFITTDYETVKQKADTPAGLP
jgi:putative transposase